MNDFNIDILKQIRQQSQDIFQYQKDLYELSLHKGKLYMEKISRSTAYHIISQPNGIINKQFKDAVDKIFVNDRIPFIERFEYKGAPYAEKDSYTVDAESGIINIDVAPIEVNIQDNEYINDFLDSRFKEYSSFIKKYLAAYTYTNFQRLPILVFYGPRGTGKSTTIDSLIRPIYPNMSIDWNGFANNFNPEAEKKLAVIDENDKISKDQYNQIKAVTGSDTLFLNQKYKQKIPVRNNLQIVLTSNNEVPLYLNPHEYPASELENQWFVWRFPHINNEPDPDYRKKLKNRLGHYIRTELKYIYENNEAEFTEGRYSISTPITSYEDELFNANRSQADIVSCKIKNQIVNNYSKFLDENTNTNFSDDFPKEAFELMHKEKFLPNKIIRYYDLENCCLLDIVNVFKKQNILGRRDRKYLDSNEYRGRNIKNWDEIEEIRNRSEN